MTKLIIQIPCFNEADTLPETLAALPRRIDGIATIEYLEIDDGSKDDTSGIARRLGVHNIVRHRRNRGLAAAFQSGVDAALRAGADIIVNTDGDGQYAGEDIANLVAPIIAGQADIVIGDRGVAQKEHMGLFKRRLQRFGSFVVRKLSRTAVTDAVSGFRAISRQIAESVDLIVQVKRLRDGSRRTTNITEVIGMEGDVIVTQELFNFEYLDESEDGKILGEFRSSGLRPYTLEKARQFGFDQAYLEACL